MYIVADIGGTKMRIAGSDDLTAFSEPVILNTPQNYQEALSLVTQTAESIARGGIIDAIAVGIACVLSPDKRTLFNHRNLADWNEHFFADDLEQALNTKVYLENDAAMVGLGEYMFGAGKDAPILAYITVSTGVNGGRIVDGHIDRSSSGFEIGGQYLNIGEPATTLEEIISGRAITLKYGMKPQELGADSPVWDELALVLAYGLNNTILHWSPDRIVLGGSMFNEIGISVDRVKVHLDTVLRKFDHLPEIVHSSLGDFGGLYGGLALLGQIRR